jgi:hypothetical protein
VRSAPYMWRRGARVSWLSLKTMVDGLSMIWPQNQRDGFLRFGLKTGGDGFLRFCLKTSGDGILVEHQNQGGGGFPGLGLKTGSYGLVIWASKSPWLFLVWASKPSWLRFVGCATKPIRGRQRGTRVEI